MRHARRYLALALCLLLVSLLSFACQSIAGIEDRTLERVETRASSPECDDYCNTVMANCVGDNVAYTSQDTCHAVCAKLEIGSSLEPVGNTVACRAAQARFAKSTGEPKVHCPRAGPGGAGVCGSNCESYCELFAQACTPEFVDPAECVKKCAALEDDGSFNAVAHHDGDSLQCRLVHVSSALVEPEEHCPHARFAPFAFCAEPDSSAPECVDFCRVVMTSCTGPLAVYESTEQCLAVCGALPPGTPADRVENTVGCRTYHAYSAIFDPASHCPHAGPGGDGHCGSPAEPSTGLTGNCESYCTLLGTACSSEFSAKFADQSACITECVQVSGAALDSRYDIATAATGNSLQCRLLHVSRALSDATACAAALGGSPCQ